jgi:hypothetical protein
VSKAMSAMILGQSGAALSTLASAICLKVSAISKPPILRR